MQKSWISCKKLDFVQKAGFQGHFSWISPWAPMGSWNCKKLDFRPIWNPAFLHEIQENDTWNPHFCFTWIWCKKSGFQRSEIHDFDKCIFPGFHYLSGISALHWFLHLSNGTFLWVGEGDKSTNPWKAMFHQTGRAKVDTLCLWLLQHYCDLRKE